MDDDDIEDAIEGSTLELVSNDQIVARYEALISLWTHRDAMANQWPSLIISASAAVLAIVFSEKGPKQIDAIANWRNWGGSEHLDVSIGTGMPVLVTGLLALPFVYGIYRSIEAMDAMVLVILEIEREHLAIPPYASFLAVNRPAGWSARRLILRGLSTMAFSLVMAGALMTFGVRVGCIVCAGVGAISIMFAQSDRFTIGRQTARRVPFVAARKGLTSRYPRESRLREAGQPAAESTHPTVAIS